MTGAHPRARFRRLSEKALRRARIHHLCRAARQGCAHRSERRDAVVELTPGTAGESAVYSASLVLDPKTPPGPSSIAVAALRSEPVEVKFDKKKPDPLVEFVRRLDDMRCDRPYLYDPRIMASENRLDVKVTVLNPKQGTPPPASTPAAPGVTPAPKK